MIFIVSIYKMDEFICKVELLIISNENLFSSPLKKIVDQVGVI